MSRPKSGLLLYFQAPNASTIIQSYLINISSYPKYHPKGSFYNTGYQANRQTYQKICSNKLSLLSPFRFLPTLLLRRHCTTPCLGSNSKLRAYMHFHSELLKVAKRRRVQCIRGEILKVLELPDQFPKIYANNSKKLRQDYKAMLGDCSEKIDGLRGY